MAYLSAKKLGLNESRRKALIKTLKYLESGKVKLYRDIRNQPKKKADLVNRFNMSDYTFECGTPACVAGWADFFLKKDKKKPFFQEHHGILQTSLDDIFSGNFTNAAMDDITPKHAAKVLRRYLEQGDGSIKRVYY